MRSTTPARCVAGVVFVALLAGVVFAQQLPTPRQAFPAQPGVPAADDDQEVLARGPVHEAYATSAEQPTSGGPVIEKRPQEPIEELPPDQKPDGDNVQWIPGYWHWDEERKDYIWISGFWRNAPPGRTWVPGGWREVQGGWQWVHGFWNVAAAGAQQAEIEYLPTPPASLETGPVVAAPTDTCFYTPGSWIYRTNRYVWRPGFWVEHRRDWCWVPDHYRWTPVGCVFVPGFWDVPLARRGVLFAPVYFRPAVFSRPRFVYTPVYAVPDTGLYTSLFVRPGSCHYYFGDYFEQRYVTAGFTSWAGASFRGTNFAVTAGVGRRYTYDPLWSYYNQAHRLDPAWQSNIANVYAGRYRGDVARPPRTLVQQNTIINNVTNVTNVTNTTNVIANNTASNTRVVAPSSPPPVMLASLKDLKQDSPAVNLTAVKADDVVKEQKLAKDLRRLEVDRRKLEAQLAATGPVVKADEKPRQVKVDLPPAVVARAQMPTAPEKAPPPPAVPVVKKIDPPATAPGGGRAALPQLPPGLGRPKVDPKPVPKLDLPKIDPTKPVVLPKPGEPVKPLVLPLKAGDPKPAVLPPKPTEPLKQGGAPVPVVVPKVEPKPVPKADPPKLDLPKPVVPKLDLKPGVLPPKVDPPKIDPKPVVLPPKMPAPAVPTPTPTPVTLPPKGEPKQLPTVQQPRIGRAVPTPVVKPPEPPSAAPVPVLAPKLAPKPVGVPLKVDPKPTAPPAVAKTPTPVRTPPRANPEKKDEKKK